MIIFYNKKTGKIVGTIEGRIHGEDHLNMWIGSKEDNDRLICQWAKIDNVWQPEEQKDIFISLDKRETKLKDYIIKGGKLIPTNQQEKQV
jgi:hypothetical protein